MRVGWWLSAGAGVAAGVMALAQPAPSNKANPGRAPSQRAPAQAPGAPSAPNPGVPGQPGVVSPDDAETRPSEMVAPAAVMLTDAGAMALRAAAFNGGAVRVLDVAGRVTDVPLEGVHALFFDPGTSARLEKKDEGARDGLRGVIVLPDGQRFRGALDPAQTTRERLVWRSPLLGVVAAPMSRVASVRFDRPAPADGRVLPPIGDASTGVALAADEVHLANGDSLRGYVKRIGEAVTLDGTDVPLERVRAIVFSAAPEVAEGARLWLDGGTVARVVSVEREVEGARPVVRFTLPTGAPGEADLAWVRAVTGEHAELRPLSAVDALEGRFEVREPAPESPLGAAGAMDIFFAGPGRARWPIGGARLFVAEVGLPERASAFAEATVAVWADDRPLARVHVDAKEGAAAVLAVLPADAKTLTVTVGAGDNGPGNAVLELRGAVLVGVRK